MNTPELHNLIERYFNADTSLDEERLLRRELATGINNSDDPVIQEACAVMGLHVIRRKPDAISRKTVSPPIWRNVAAVAVAIAVTGSLLSGVIRQQSTGECVAYVNGQRISDRDAVMKLMFADLNEMEEASNCIEASITTRNSRHNGAIGVRERLKIFWKKFSDNLRESATLCHNQETPII